MSQNKEMTAILLSPRVSEKASLIADKYRQFTFKVLRTATKYNIADAVESLFKVKVKAVRTVSVKGKKRRFGGIEGRTKDWKKAYVTLQEGFDIDFTGVE